MKVLYLAFVMSTIYLRAKSVYTMVFFIVIVIVDFSKKNRVHMHCIDRHCTSNKSGKNSVSKKINPQCTSFVQDTGIFGKSRVIG